MRHVRDAIERPTQVHLQLLKLRFECADFLAKLASFLDKLLLFRRVLLLGNKLGDLVGALLLDLRRLHQVLALVVELHDAVDVGLHVAICAIRLDGIEVVADELCVEHI